MAEPNGSLPEVYLQPGEARLVTEPTILRTVLGSCVGVAFRVPRLGLGALCHPMLPRCPANRREKLSVTAGRRYVDFAIREMAQRLNVMGAQRGEAEVKIFGGGDVLLVGDGASRPTVGELNCEAALRVLEEEAFTVSACSLGGTSGVHIQFDTGTGNVLLRRLDPATMQRKPESSRKTHRCGRKK